MSGCVTWGVASAWIRTGDERQKVHVYVCVWSKHLPLSCPNIKEYTLIKPNTLRKYQLIELTLQENAMLTLYGHTHWRSFRHTSFPPQRLNYSTTHNHYTRKCSTVNMLCHTSQPTMWWLVAKSINVKWWKHSGQLQFKTTKCIKNMACYW